MIRTVVFDMDGTILNTLADLSAAVNYALSLCGYPPKSKEEIKKALGNGAQALIRETAPKNITDRERERCLAMFKDYYSKNMYAETAPYPGIIELCSALKAEGRKLAVVSNKFDSAVKKLCGIYFKNIFDAAVGESPSIRKKPAPDSVFKALAELDSSTREAVYIGDSEVDYNTAVNSGLPCICVTWGFRDRGELERLGARLFADKPAEILDLIKNI